MSDRPAPEDLPEDDDSPYAAVDRLMGTPPDARATSSPAPRPGLSRTSLIAIGLVVVLLAVTALVTWTWGSDEPPVATPGQSSQPTTPAPSRTPTPSIAGSAPAAGGFPASLRSFYTQQVSWQPCSDNAKQECAAIDVPVDYAKPSGDTFELALRKVPATAPASRIGSLVINPGGPGGSGIEYATYANYVFGADVRRSYDVIGFDPRGIGASSPVSCLTDDQLDQLFAEDPTPDTPAERAALIGHADATAKACAAKGGQRALHMSSTEVARDLDIIRELVGDEQLNYFGVSYGTFLGALYADLFPAKVGRFVLDSALSPNQTAEQEMDYDIQGFEASIDAFVNWCVARDDCAFGRDKAGARDRIAALLDRVDQHPLRTSTPGLERVGEGWVGFAIFMCLYSDATWPTLNKGLAEAIDRGVGDTLLAKAMEVVDRKANGTYATSTYLQAMLPVRCADWARTRDTAALKAAQAKAQADHPLWAKLTGALYDICTAWPAAGRAATGSTLGVGAGPILVIGNLRDPATPIDGTKQLAADLESGVLVTSDHDGHGTYFAGSSCVDAIVDDYLVSGQVPSGDTAC